LIRQVTFDGSDLSRSASARIEKRRFDVELIQRLGLHWRDVELGHG
jgi:hypothetical protein